MKLLLQALAIAGTISLGLLPQSDLRSAELRCQGAYATSSAVLGDSNGCLACHDGVIAKNSSAFGAGVSIHAQKGNHPVLMSYDRAHQQRPMAFVTPAALDPKLQLVDGKVQCITCHVVSTQQEWTTISLMGRRDFCLGCHRK